MGTLGRARASHYWMQDSDFGSDNIRGAMIKNRYMEITANLSFAPRGSPSGWGKIEWLDGVLRIQCRTATGITQSFAVDESMFKVLSKYCPWVQFMPRKPIKRGKLGVGRVNFKGHISISGTCEVGRVKWDVLSGTC